MPVVWVNVLVVVGVTFDSRLVYVLRGRRYWSNSGGSLVPRVERLSDETGVYNRTSTTMCHL